MSKHVCPWWLGYFLISPFRKLSSGDPERLLSPYLRDGMTILEPGPGMGFFTLPMARVVGPSGRVFVVDIQPKMLASLRRRAIKAGVDSRIETRLVQPDSLDVSDLAAKVDFVLAVAMVHELPNPDSFFREAAAAMKPGAKLLLAEPPGHVNQARWDDEIAAALGAGLHREPPIAIRHSLAALFVR